MLDNGNVGIGGAIPNTRVTIQDNGNYHIFMDRANSTPGGDNPVFAVYNSSSIPVATYGWGWYDSSADGNLSLWRRNLSTTGVQVVDFNRSNGNVRFTNNIVATGSITTGVASSANGTVTINRSSGTVGLIIRGSDGNTVGAGNVPVYEPYNYADASHNFNIGHASIGNYNWYAGSNATLNLNTQLMRLTRGGNLLINTTTDAGYRLDVSGSARITDGLTVTGSLIATSFTGSLLGTASWAINALTASFVNTASTNAFVQGGNSFGAQALLGTNDTQNLALETSGSVRMFISSSGQVGIGTSTPISAFTIQTSGSIQATQPIISIVSGSTFGGWLIYTGSSERARYAWNTGDGAYIYTPSTDPFTIYK